MQRKNLLLTILMTDWIFWKSGTAKAEFPVLTISPFVGSVLPVDEVTLWAHNVGAKVLVDACQSVPHMVVDVQSLNVDFLVASSHKVWVLLVVSFSS